MPRSAIDATRFTATSPHAYSKPSPMRASAPSSSSTYSPGAHSLPSKFQPINRSSKNAAQFKSPSPTPAGPTSETPLQKVARLRAARRAAKLAEISLWDRIVLRGRVVADIAHRVTALSLIGFTVIAGGVTVYALSDMVIYNRRKRNAFFADQAAAQLTNLLAAIENEKANLPLTEEQALVLNRERMRFREEEEKERRKRERWERWERWDPRKLMLAGLKVEDDGVVPSVPEGRGVLKAVEEKGREGIWKVVASAVGVQTKRREPEASTAAVSHLDQKPGDLNRMSERAAELGKKKTGWATWFGGKGVKVEEEKGREGVWNDVASAEGVQTERREPETPTAAEESHLDRKPGDLDRMAERAAELGKKKTGWATWLGGK